MTVSRNLLFLVIAIVCFAIGLLIAVLDSLSGDTTPWLFGGLALFAAAHLP